MKNNSKIGWPVIISLLLSPVYLFAQDPSVQTFADKKEILIGEQIKIKILTKIPAISSASQFSIAIPDSIQHFDIIDKGKTDTISFKDNSKAIEQTITITSFDSGRWTFPSFDVKFAQADQHLYQLKTDSIAINVYYSPADSTNQLRDIKPIIKVTVADYMWYYIAGSIVIFMLIAFLTWRYLKNRKLKPSLLVKAKLSPYDEAIQDLEKLKQYDLQNAEQIKLYHSSLAVILKRYNGRKQNKNLLNKTTGDLLMEMTKNNFSPDNISKLASALRCSDAVKFAKYIPLNVESEDCMLKIKEAIILIENSRLTGSSPSVAAEGQTIFNL